MAVINKDESNYTGNGKTYGQTEVEVCTGNIYEMTQSNAVTCGVMERWT